MSNINVSVPNEMVSWEAPAHLITAGCAIYIVDSKAAERTTKGTGLASAKVFAKLGLCHRFMILLCKGRILLGRKDSACRIYSESEE